MTRQRTSHRTQMPTTKPTLGAKRLTNPWQPAGVCAALLTTALLCFPVHAQDSAPDSAHNHAHPHAQGPEIVKLSEQPWYEAADKAVARELISPRNSSAQAMSIAEIKIPPGVVIIPHHHVMEEVYHIVSGSGVMMVEDETTRVVPGDSVLVPPHAWHNITNDTDEDLVLIVTCAPAWAPDLLQFDRTTQRPRARDGN